jgi:hypothetical protein
MQLIKALRLFLAENPWKRSLPCPELLRTDTLVFASWYGCLTPRIILLNSILTANRLSISQSSRKPARRNNGTMDPTYNKGPLFWYKLSNHGSVLFELEEQYVLSKAGADVEAGYERYPQYTPIIEASELGVWDGGAICALLSLGADVTNAKGVSGDSGNLSYKLLIFSLCAAN